MIPFICGVFAGTAVGILIAAVVRNPDTDHRHCRERIARLTVDNHRLTLEVDQLGRQIASLLDEKWRTS